MWSVRSLCIQHRSGMIAEACQRIVAGIGGSTVRCCAMNNPLPGQARTHAVHARGARVCSLPACSSLAAGHGSGAAVDQAAPQGRS